MHAAEKNVAVGKHPDIIKFATGTGGIGPDHLAVVDEVQRAKPAAAKGRDLKSVTLSTTMGPGIRIDTTKVKDLDEDLQPV